MKAKIKVFIKNQKKNKLETLISPCLQEAHKNFSFYSCKCSWKKYLKITFMASISPGRHYMCTHTPSHVYKYLYMYIYKYVK